MKSKIDNNLRNAKNIGATIEKYLNEIGIFTLAVSIRRNAPFTL